MKKSRYSEQQIAFILKQADDGTSIEEVYRKAGMSQQTYYRWRKKCAGLMPSEVRCLKQIEEETPGLMLGLAGIGYFYLRVADSKVPSILEPLPACQGASSVAVAI